METMRELRVGGLCLMRLKGYDYASTYLKCCHGAAMQLLALWLRGKELGTIDKSNRDFSSELGIEHRV